MPVCSILQLGNPLLNQKSHQVENCCSPEMLGIIRDLSDTLAAFRASHGYGRGIAAVQIGVLQRLVYVHMQPTGFCGPLINPVVTWSSQERLELWDDCFSIPDLMVKVERAARIQVTYFDEFGQSKTLAADGDFSELLQHEIDHLDGILTIHRAVSPTAFATRSEWDQRYKDQR